MLATIKPKLTVSLRGLISAPISAPNVSEAHRRLSNLLTEAGFTDGTFNNQMLLECNHDRLIATGQSLFKKFSPFIDIRDPGDKPTPPIGTTDQRITPRVTMDQVITPIRDSPKGEHTISSHYASAKLEEDSYDSLEIQRMQLGLRDTGILRKQFERNGAEAQAGKPSATQFMTMMESDQVISHFRAVMKKYELDQAV